MFTWVHYEDLGTKQGKNACIWVSIMSFSIFLPTLVNHTQDLMCLKYKENLNYKLHPSVYRQVIPFVQKGLLVDIHKLQGVPKKNVI